MPGQISFTIDIVYNDIETCFSIPDEFVSKFNNLVASFISRKDHLENKMNPIETPIELSAQFIAYCKSYDKEITGILFKNFKEKFLGTKDIHLVCYELELTKPQISNVLNGYYSILDLEIYDEYHPPLPAAFSDSSIKLMALFGGQGGAYGYFEELAFIYHAYYSLVIDFVRQASCFLNEASKDMEFMNLYRDGLDFNEWLVNPEEKPSTGYLLSSPVSLPLTGITQLLQFLVTFKTLRISPGELARSFEASVGHSHGIVIATAISCSTDETSFYDNSLKALGILLLVGAFGQLEYPLSELDKSPELDFNKTSNVSPSPMVLIKGLNYKQLDRTIANFNNKYNFKYQHVHISVINTPIQIVVSGITDQIIKFVRFVNTEYASSNQNQSRVPHSQRKPVVATEYLSLTVPYHCDIYDQAVDNQYQYSIDKGWIFNSIDMQVAVRANDDGHDIRNEIDLTKYLFQSIMSLPVNWPVVVDCPETTHIVDFGPGGASGFGRLAHQNIEGRGISIICASAPVQGNPEFGIRADLYKPDNSNITRTSNWIDQYSPTLVRTEFDDKINISTKMSRLLGKPPIIVSGMTPTTGNEDLTATVLNAGYHVEFACSGINTRIELETKLHKFVNSIEPGYGITLNLTYLNQNRWLVQFPMIVDLRKKGVPIEGLCIGGGVPSLDVTSEIINTIRNAGFCHIAFKPGSIESIYRVIDIAKASPDFPIFLQWTGGRSGGHHSFEDFHQPVLDTYRAIRKQNNIILIAGSGFGGADDTFPYFTGEWSTRFGCTPMPFDGVLFGSRMMVAKESRAADSIKELIVAAQGVSDYDWEQTYAGPAGGVITIKSEFGEPVHVIYNKCTALWRELDETIFSVPRKERLQAILDMKEHITSRLNSDYTRPWFGTLPDGRIVDVEDMTYLEVAIRLANLLYIKHEDRWTHQTHAKLFDMFLFRVEERFANTCCDNTMTILDLSNPHKIIERVFDAHPGAATQLLTSEDVKYFVELCKRRGQKPVPFIPIFDEDFETWFKKDTSWQSEDLSCVPNQDPQRVPILQGPVSVQYSTEANIPVKVILDEIHSKLIDKLLKNNHGGNPDTVRKMACLANTPSAVPIPKQIIQSLTDAEWVFSLPNERTLLPDDDSWASILSGNQSNWIYAFLTAQSILDGTKIIANNIRNVLRPREGNNVRVSLNNNTPRVVEIIGSDKLIAVRACLQDNFTIDIDIYNHLKSGSTSLQLQYLYCPNRPFMPFTRINTLDINPENRLFRESKRLGSSDTFELPYTTEGHSSSSFDDHYIDKERFIRYLKTLGCSIDKFRYGSDGELVIPTDYMMILTYQLFANCTIYDHYACNMLNLVHQSNSTTLIPSTKVLCTGDTISAIMDVISVTNTGHGTQIKLKATINRDSENVAEVLDTVFIKGSQIAIEDTFSLVDEQSMRVMIKGKQDISILNSKEWFLAKKDTIDSVGPGSILEFVLQSEYRFKTPSVYSQISTTGKVQLLTTNGTHFHIGDVDYHSNTSFGNPVIEYLKRVGTPANPPIYFNDYGYPVLIGSIDKKDVIRAPQSNHMYSYVSGDHNPIHTNPYVADYAGLSTTITHGMCTSALSRAFIDYYAANGHPERVVAYDVDFVDIVSPGDTLIPSFDHIGMKNGRMLIKGSTINQDSNKVLEFTAEVEQPPTAYIFTGQGSQSVGMGMDLYRSSQIARSVWDKGDKHFIKKYGISILDIVIKNPIKHTVYFDGKRGATIRDNYIGLVPNITKSTRYYTFTSPKGLLHMTQFTQPALVLFEMAAITDMKKNGLVQLSSLFAGHSLGEYSALCAVGEILSIEDMLDIVFCRGLLMQQVVERNRYGKSEYSMISVNPSRIGSFFSKDDLMTVVKSVSVHGNGLLEVVNYNVNQQQYVVAGTVHQLKILSVTLDELSKHTDYNSELMYNIAQRCVARVSDERAKSDNIKLERGIATTPLPDIDIPFHSSLLDSIVGPLRQCIEKKINDTSIDYTHLCSRYIPNLIGEPFMISREYLEKVFGLTGSISIKNVLDEWDITMQTNIERQQTIRVLLVELLAYQVAHPVQWISTQDYILTNNRAEHIVEIGPAQVLTNMIKKSVDISSTDITVLSIVTDRDKIYYQDKNNIKIDKYNADKSERESSQNVNKIISSDSSENAQEQVPMSELSQPSVPLKSDQPAVSVPDIPLSPLFVIKAIIAQKIKQDLPAILDTASIGSLSKDKSTLQNEIIGDLKREFGGIIFDISEEIPLEELASRITPYTGILGGYTTTQISRMFRIKLPGGFNQSNICNYLKLAYGLGPQRCDAILLLALTSEPKGRLSSDAEAKEWLDKIVYKYANINEITLNKFTESGSDIANNNNLTTTDIKALEKAQANQKYLSNRLIEIHAKSIDIDLRDGYRTAEQLRKERDFLQNSLDKLESELGSEFMSGIGPLFDSRKTRHFNSYWNWVRQDALVLIYDILADKVNIESDEAKERQHMLKMRATPSLLNYLSFCIKQLESLKEGNSLNPIIATISKLYQECKESLDALPTYALYSVPTRPHTYMDFKHNIAYKEILDPNVPSREAYIEKMRSDYGDGYPLVYVKTGTKDSNWAYNTSLTNPYLESLSEIYGDGMTFSGMHVLITGCGRTSIGEEMLKGFLSGGAKVIATTSSYSRKIMLYFEDIYKRYGSRGSELVVVPFNQGSAEDIKDLVSFIYRSPDNRDGGLGWDLDVVVPFAALPNPLGDITSIGSYAELSLRAMLTNIHRLLGEIVSQKIELRYSTKVTRTILPLSINHGQLGGSGLYSESKIALETLMNRWYSESWSDYMSIIGAMIGWTRGTTQMINNSIASVRIEEFGAYTFTNTEMAAFILCALSDQLCSGAISEPIVIDLGGRYVANNAEIMLMDIRNEIVEDSNILKGVTADISHDYHTICHSNPGYRGINRLIKPRANYKLQFPKYRAYEELMHLHHLQEMVNLDKVVVITGFGEVGPYGNSTTRWEMEAYGEFSLEGCVELSWVMGYIKFFSGILKSTGKQYTGWVDSKTGIPIADIDVKARYEKQIIEHTGIRLIEPELHDGYDPNNKTFMRELQIEHDMEPFETNKEEAEHFKLKHGDKVDIWEIDSKTWSVRFLKGAIIIVPKALRFDCTVAGQVPTGWDPVRYGIPEGLAEQIDQATCYTIVATVEALLRSGITDPFELYKYFYVNEVGNTIGSGLGNIHSTTKMYVGRLMENNDVQSDILQETLVNTIPAWINMLLLSSSGPIKPVVGACATTVLSIDAAIETIQCGRAKVVFTGGTDDFGEELSYEFAQIGAINNKIDDAAHGRTPSEMSRPCTSTRSGFVESEGSGIAILMSASAAIEMGAPIYGIVALSSIATDKIGRSVPAPGQGILTTASESLQAKDSKLLDFNYRKLRLEKHLQIIDQQASELEDVSELEIKSFEAARKAKLDEWGNEFWKNDKSISPLRGALAVWGLDVDDIGVISMHGTSTIANDINESEIFNLQFKHLGRTPGNIVPAIAQKWLTGHPKGPAAAWMLNGLLQVLDTGLIPGNRNADNIEKKLEQFEYLLYPSDSIQTSGIKAGLLKSFGFGQVGGEMLVLHPDYLLATLSRDKLEQYQKKVEEREKKIYRYWHDTFTDNHKFVQLKDESPYTKEQEQRVYLDPNARVKYNTRTEQYHF